MQLLTDLLLHKQIFYGKMLSAQLKNHGISREFYLIIVGSLHIKAVEGAEVAFHFFFDMVVFPLSDSILKRPATIRVSYK